MKFVLKTLGIVLIENKVKKKIHRKGLEKKFYFGTFEPVWAISDLVGYD